MTTIKEKLSVAIPWSLSHYIPLNGFHPLYRALFEECPADVTLNAWDNVLLSNLLRQDPGVRQALLAEVAGWRAKLKLAEAGEVPHRYFEAVDVPNLAATAALPGDIEFHHTAPFPSMTRPFVIHCESFAPFFFPFSAQGGDNIGGAMQARAHYAAMLENPLCLGIFSHIPHTLEELSRFFGSPVIDAKLFASRIGVSRHALAQHSSRAVRNSDTPTFLFINSANQNPQNFIHRGGHIVLRAWPAILAALPGARLYLRCARPSERVLAAHGVDAGFIAGQDGRSIIWIEEFLNNRELNNLMRAAHFFLLPSISLHSVSILQSMAFGVVPVVSDTIGPTRYLTDGESGIVLEGVQATHWRADPATGILVDDFGRNAALDESLVEQLVARVTGLWQNPAGYHAMAERAAARAASDHAGSLYADDFWRQIQALWEAAPPHTAPAPGIGALHGNCLVAPADWPRLFESTPQPLRRLYTGTGMVTELGGSFIAMRAGGIDLHGWSVLAEYCREGAPALRLAASIDALGGAFLAATKLAPARAPRRVVMFVARLLAPFPGLYRVARRALAFARRLRAATLPPPPAPEPTDIQLLEENVSGLNVLRCADLYCAIPQEAGEFSLNKLRAGGYRLSFTGNSLRQVMDKIAAHTASQPPAPAIALVEEGFHGLNIIRYGEMFVAIPQGEGAFDPERVRAQGYSRSFSDTNLAALKDAVMQVLA
jgi:glycosyltransferase involved in cell wall biosynthesis